MKSKIYAVVPAAGRGVRMGGDRPKQFLELAGRPILVHTLDLLFHSGLLSGVILVVPADFLPRVQELAESYCAERTGAHFHGLPEAGGMPDNGLSISVVAGGAQRQDSVYNALSRLPEDCGWVMVHDGVRPFASRGLLAETVAAALKTGASIAAVASTDTVKRVEGGVVVETLAREHIWLVQTPQVFRRDLILEAYNEARRQGWVGTDDASFVERLGVPVAIVPGERSNIKVTTPEDLVWASWFLSKKE